MFLVWRITTALLAAALAVISTAFGVRVFGESADAAGAVAGLGVLVALAVLAGGLIAASLLATAAMTTTRWGAVTVGVSLLGVCVTAALLSRGWLAVMTLGYALFSAVAARPQPRLGS